jgi:hypothetical protein
LIARQDGIVDVISNAKIEGQLAIESPCVLGVGAGVPMRLLICGAAYSYRVSGGITAWIIDVEDLVGSKRPSSLLLGVDVHHKRIAIKLNSEFQLMRPFDEGKVVREVEHTLSLDTSCRAGAERNAGIGFFGVPSQIGSIGEQRLSILPRDVGRDCRQVDSVVDTELVE